MIALMDVSVLGRNSSLAFAPQRGGAAAEEVKVCTLCNVVVNSQKAYEYHITGQKHAAMVKKSKKQKLSAES